MEMPSRPNISQYINTIFNKKTRKGTRELDVEGDYNIQLHLGSYL
jgi:hypothetical protein